MRTDYKHDAAYKARKDEGLQAVPQPWQWFTGAQLLDLTKRAHQVAAWQNRLELLDGEGFTDQELREFFIETLIDQFTTYVTAAAHQVGGCWPTGQAAIEAMDRVRRLEAEIPRDWRPQYPAYKKVAPASAANASGAVISAVEGNANDHDSKH